MFDTLVAAGRTVWHRLYRSYRGFKKKRVREKKMQIRFPPRPAYEPTRYLAVAATMKNEGCYLREWIEFQRLMGVDQIYLYDNGSTDDSAEVVAPYVAEGTVHVFPWATFDT